MNVFNILEQKNQILGPNAFQGCTRLEYIYTNLIYSNETFGSFEVRRTSELMCSSDLGSSERSGLKNVEIACIVIFGVIFAGYYLYLFFIFHSLQKKEK